MTEEVEPGVERIIRDDAGHDLDERHPTYRYDMDGIAITPDGTVCRGPRSSPRGWRHRTTTEALRQQRVRQLDERLAAGPRWRDRDFVFATSIGTPMDARSQVRAFHAALTRAGIPVQPFHQLRHACATLLLESGEELANISKLLGHSSLATTADFYGHLTPETTRRAADRMGAILAG